MAKKKTTKNSADKKSKNSRLIAFLKSHKLTFALTIILLLVLFITVLYPKYKDWDNAQLIKGLARDFPILVGEIEQATGLDLEIKPNCSTTTEKFSSGVKTCEAITGTVGDVNKKLIEGVVISNPTFSLKGNNGINVKYKDMKSCQLWFASEDRFALSCLVGVRDANTQLAIEEFSEINN